MQTFPAVRFFLIKLVCLLALGCGGSALATEPSPDSVGQPFAKVWRIRGEVFASGPEPGRTRRLQEGSAVNVGDRIRALGSGEAVLKTADAGIVAVRPGTEFVAENFVAAGKPTDTSVLRVFSGSLRVLTGWIGQLNRSGHKVYTPTATIGIRGTDHEPYVMSAEMAAKTSYKEGTYNKVNRGRTALEVGEHSLDIEAGRVGFAQAPKFKKRALLTVLMPVLLDKIPDFYVPGEFDAELDRHSATMDAESRRELEKIGGSVPQEAVAPAAAEVPPVQVAMPAASASTASKAPLPVGCDPAATGRAWVEALDGAITRLDADAIVAAFAPDVVVRASVRNKEGALTTVELGRDELARSTLSAVKSLEDYRHRRVSMASVLAGPEAGNCDRIAIKSVVVEQGRQSGKSFRFESLEEYLIEKRDGKWLAVKAETTQR